MDSRDKWRKGVIRSWDDAYAYANTNDGNGLALWLEDRLYDPVAFFELQESDMSFRVDAIGFGDNHITARIDPS